MVNNSGISSSGSSPLRQAYLTYKALEIFSSGRSSSPILQHEFIIMFIALFSAHVIAWAGGARRCTRSGKKGVYA